MLQGVLEGARHEPLGDGVGAEKSGLSTRQGLPVQMPLINAVPRDWGRGLRLACGFLTTVPSAHRMASLINYWEHTS